MKHFLTIFTAFAALISCGGTAPKSGATQATKLSAEPQFYTYQVVAEYPHSRSSYTQGLQFVDGELWEGTGEYGRSRLLRTDLATGKALQSQANPKDEFGEGITVLGDKIYQLTWLNEEANIYDANGNWLRSIPYKGEGWGITSDGEKLYMSNGSSNINIVDPETLERKKTINVKYGKRPLQYLNELEWIDGKIWANIYTYNEDKIVVIDPSTGAVEAYLDLRSLRNTQHSNMDADVLNGIAYDPATGHIFVTGKCWNKLFEIEVIK